MLSLKANDAHAGTEEMAKRVSDALKADKKVLWLLCGGSNIPVAVKAMDSVKKAVDKVFWANLTVAQTDERYGAVGHKDSNWQQMKDAGLDLLGVIALPMIIGKSLDATVVEYTDKMRKAFSDTLDHGGIIVGLFGIGADGHIAGILPGSPAVSDAKLVCGYRADPFTRITLTPAVLKKVSVAYAFAFGNAKKAALEKLEKGTLPFNEEPAQLLKELPEAFLYSDF